MAYITEFSISGLAGRDAIYEKKLNRDTNIFFGLNGSGKTSLLKILASAMRFDTTLLKNVPFKSAKVKIYSVDFDKTFTYSIEQLEMPLSPTTPESRVYGSMAFEESEEISRRSEFAWKITPKLPKNSRGNWVLGYLPTSRIYRDMQRYRAREYQKLSDEMLDEYFAQSLEEIWTRYNAGVLLSVRKAQEDGLASIMKAVLSTKEISAKDTSKNEIQDVSDAYNRVSSFLKRQGSPDILGSRDQFGLRYAENAQLRSIVSDIDRVEREIEKATKPINELQNLILKMFSGNKTIKFENTKIDVVSGETRIGLQSLSSGEKQILRIFIEAIRFGDNCIIIDEPEISLHIQWQKELIADLRLLNPNTQLILATHSPEIMADIDDSRIFNL